MYSTSVFIFCIDLQIQIAEQKLRGDHDEARQTSRKGCETPTWTKPLSTTTQSLATFKASAEGPIALRNET